MIGVSAMRSLSRSAAGLFFFLHCPAFSQESTEPSEPAAEAPETTAPAQGTITLELNKLEPTENACHAYMVVDNQSPEPLNELTIDVYLFDKQGVILRGVALPFVDVRAGRAMVVPFELPDLDCGEIGRVLLNKVLACTDSSGAAVEGCADLLTLSTRAEAAFEY